MNGFIGDIAAGAITEVEVGEEVDRSSLLRRFSAVGSVQRESDSRKVSRYVIHVWIREVTVCPQTGVPERSWQSCKLIVVFWCDAHSQRHCLRYV